MNDYMNVTNERMPREAADLDGRVALVTGASGSIGAEVARRLAARGAAVVVHGRDAERLEAVASTIRADGGAVVVHVGDVRDEHHLDEVVAAAAREFGPVSIAVTLAGGDGAPVASDALTADRWREVVDTDLTSTFLTIHAVLPGMLALGDGRIVTVASSAGRRASRANAAYAAAKAGVVMLTQHLALEFAPRGIRVNCVAPSMVETDKLRSRMPRPQLEAIAAHVPLGRIGRPADVADAILHLASDESSWTTGITLDLTGGMTL